MANGNPPLSSMETISDVIESDKATMQGYKTMKTKNNRLQIVQLTAIKNVVEQNRASLIGKLTL